MKKSMVRTALWLLAAGATGVLGIAHAQEISGVAAGTDYLQTAPGTQAMMP